MKVFFIAAQLLIGTHVLAETVDCAHCNRDIKKEAIGSTKMIEQLNEKISEVAVNYSHKPKKEGGSIWTESNLESRCGWVRDGYEWEYMESVLNAKFKDGDAWGPEKTFPYLICPGQITGKKKDYFRMSFEHPGIYGDQWVGLMKYMVRKAKRVDLLTKWFNTKDDEGKTVLDQWDYAMKNYKDKWIGMGDSNYWGMKTFEKFIIRYGGKRAKDL